MKPCSTTSASLALTEGRFASHWLSHFDLSIDQRGGCTAKVQDTHTSDHSVDHAIEGLLNPLGGLGTNIEQHLMRNQDQFEVISPRQEDGNTRLSGNLSPGLHIRAILHILHHI